MFCFDTFITSRRAFSADRKSTVPPMALQAVHSTGVWRSHTHARTHTRQQTHAHTPPTGGRARCHLALPLSSDTHCAVSAATFSPTPSHAATSSMDSSAQLRVCRVRVWRMGACVHFV
jgi:hypothetical protein